MMSPRWLLLYPGLMLVAAGLAAEGTILRGPVIIDGVGFDIHTMLYASGATILGLQLVLFSLIARAIGYIKAVLPMTSWYLRFIRAFSLERGIALGAAIGVCGLFIAVYSVKLWMAGGLSALDPASMMRVAIPSVTLMLAGAEIIFGSFVLSMIDVQFDSEWTQLS